MTFDREQRGIIFRSILAIGMTLLVLAAGYLWLPTALPGVDPAPALAERIAFVLKWDLLMFMWLAGCIQAVARGRFRSAPDRKGSAYAPPSAALAVRAAVLQNSLEQVVICFGAHLALATLLRGRELVLIPLLVLLFLVGRIAFAATYAKGAVARAFGMSLTGAAAIAGYAIAVILIVSGR